MLYFCNTPERTVGTFTASVENKPVRPGIQELCGFVMYVDEGGYATPIITAIRDIKVIKDKVVIVSFVDGSQEKAVCAEEDTFSIENGVTICLMKKLLSHECFGSGTSVYNNLIRHAMKKVGADKREEEERQNKIRAEKAARNKAHDEESKRRKRDRQYLVDICAEAIKKALGEKVIFPDDIPWEDDGK